MNTKSLFTDDEFNFITSKNTLYAWRIVLFDWAVIIATFVLCAHFPNPFTILLGIFILGSRQLGLAVVVHETGHRTFFSSNKLNDWVGNWLTGYWVFSNKDSYMKVHLKHHQFAGTQDDPDLNNYRNYPISRTSLQRKIIRDLTGQIGWRRIKSIGRSIRKLGSMSPQSATYLKRSIAINLVMITVMSSFGAAWLYLMWLVAFMTTHMLVVRIRQIGEHAAVPDLTSTDARLNTRTLHINWLERLFIAPHGVNFHLEHHILASVPIYRLKDMHRLLLKKGYYDGMRFQRGYYSLLNGVSVA